MKPNYQLFCAHPKYIIEIFQLRYNRYPTEKDFDFMYSLYGHPTNPLDLNLLVLPEEYSLLQINDFRLHSLNSISSCIGLEQSYQKECLFVKGIFSFDCNLNDESLIVKAFLITHDRMVDSYKKNPEKNSEFIIEQMINQKIWFNYTYSFLMTNQQELIEPTIILDWFNRLSLK